MSNKIARKDGPEPGTKDWADACESIRDRKKSPQPFCGQAGGRRTDGQPCESPHIKKNGLCKMHGGNSRAGVQSGPWKHGRYSAFAKALPARFRQAYEAALNDDGLLSLRNEIALTDVRTFELLEQLGDASGSEAWVEARRYAMLIRTEARKDEPDLDKLMDLASTLADIADNGVEEHRKWKEVRDQTDHRRKLVESERGRIKELHSMLSANEALTLAARFVDIVMKHVTAPDTRAELLYEFEALVGRSRAEERRARFMLTEGADVSHN